MIDSSHLNVPFPLSSPGEEDQTYVQWMWLHQVGWRIKFNINININVLEQPIAHINNTFVLYFCSILGPAEALRMRTLVQTGREGSSLNGGTPSHTCHPAVEMKSKLNNI